MKEKISLGATVLIALCLVVMAYVSCGQYRDTRSVGDAQKAFAQGIMGARQEAYNFLIKDGISVEAQRYAEYINSQGAKK